VSPTMSSQAEALNVRPASNNGRPDAQESQSRQSSIIPTLLTSNEHPTHERCPMVIVQSVTDKEAGPYRPTSPFSHHVGYGLTQRASPESEQQDSRFGNPAAHSTMY